jgi:hypothetical protein
LEQLLSKENDKSDQNCPPKNSQKCCQNPGCNSDSDDWKIEYEQMSEDIRSYSNLGWQAPIAVLVGDALILGPIATVGRHVVIDFFLLILTGSLTLLMAWVTSKWIIRSNRRARRIAELEKAHNFKRFEQESTFLSFPIGWILALIMVLVGTTLFLTGFLVITHILVPPL